MPSNTVKTDHRDKLRRLRVLQRLEQLYPHPVGELAILDYLRTDPELAPDLERVRESLWHLNSFGLVDLVQMDGLPWLAGSINELGQRWLAGDYILKNIGVYQLEELPEPANDANHNGRVSSVETLPTEVRMWLDSELVRLGFRNYTDLHKGLQEQGFQISRSAVGRYGKALKGRIKQQKEKAEVIRSLADVFEDDAPAIMQGSMGIALTAVMDAIQEGEYTAGKETLSKLVGVLPKLGQGFRNAERHKIERETRKATLEEAANRVEEAAQARGLSAKDAKFWREQVLKGM